MRLNLFCLVIVMILSSCDIRVGSRLGKSNTTPISNDLDKENSEYLKRYANDLIQWQAWSDKVLERAEREQKLLLISIGYASCYQCEVMDEESFRETDIADYINRNYIPIKIDRDERPDLAMIYGAACELRNKNSKVCHGPINALALPNGQPFWASSYLDKEMWSDALSYFAKQFHKDEDNMEMIARQLTENIRNVELATHKSIGAFKFKKQGVHFIATQLMKTLDAKKGGTKGRMKYPIPHSYQFLMHYHYVTRNQKPLEAINILLQNLAKGGIYDQLGGGFSSHTLDKDWKYPAFEKPLDINAQLISLYADAYHLTKHKLYKKIALETLEFVEQNLKAPNGGFYNGVGVTDDENFFTWTKEEIKSAIKYPEVANIFCDYYSITDQGNWNNTNILFESGKKVEIKKQYNLTTSDLEKILNTAKKKLLTIRPRGIVDTKMVTAKNAQMLKAYVDAYRVFGEVRFLEAAVNNGNFLITSMKDDLNRLRHLYQDGNAYVNGFLDDYAFTIDAFMTLYQATFDEKWLYESKKLGEYATSQFFDVQTDMYYYTSILDAPLIVRKVDMYDKLAPSSNSMMAKNLYLLSLFFYDGSLEKQSRNMMAKIVPTVGHVAQPSYFSNWGILYNHLVHEPYEVAILGDKHIEMRNKLYNKFLPNVLLAGGYSEGTLEFLQGKLVEGETMIYVCQNRTCKIPTTEMEEALQMISNVGD